MTATSDQTGGEALPRDRHLFGPGPKRILSLDGGGVRGAISVAFLERIEKIIQEEHARTNGNGAAPPRLGDYFDIVGGTSTGAVIAGALALGKNTSEIKDFYLKLAPRIFSRPFWRVPGLLAKFDAKALREEIDNIVKDRRLDSPDLITGLCVVTKRLDTGSPWILANNSRAPYWETTPSDPVNNRKGHTGNREYRLANLVRASTAAPHFFDPEIIAINEDERKQPLADANARLAGMPWLSLLVSKLRLLLLEAGHGARGKNIADTHGIFVDGGVTPFNNPTMALLMMTQLKGFGLEWPLGPKNLSIVSIGTGSSRVSLSFKELGIFGPLRVTLSALLSLMSDVQTLSLAQMQWLGECPDPWEINSEIGQLAGDAPPGGKWFRFLRYDVRLDPVWLKQNLQLDFTDREVDKFRKMDDPGIIKNIYAIARLAAELQVKREHFFPNVAPASAAGVQAPHSLPLPTG
ncbi:MAG TPA: patatin-like phospholipase family protein [Sphingomicrobium sp.]|nr:patatin-like phospholipase family protein [Sphingomicrobium sp.]